MKNEDFFTFYFFTFLFFVIPLIYANFAIQF